LIGQRDLHLAPDPRSGAEMTLLRMLAFQPPGGGVQKRDGGVVHKSASKIEAGKPVITEQAKLKAVSGVSEWQKPDWAALIGQLSLTGANKLLASNCAYIRRDGNVVCLGLDGRSESLLTNSRQTAISSALSTHFGEKLRVEITIGEAGSETPLQREARRSDEKMEAARTALEADPNVKALQDMFGAELKTESIELIKNQSAAIQE
jgi:DNA polymerase-3 subunit gamma/tau